MRIEPTVGDWIRRTKPVITFLVMEIDHSTDMNGVMSQIHEHPTPFIFNALGSSILIETDAEKEQFLNGFDFMWRFQEDKKEWHASGIFNG